MDNSTATVLTLNMSMFLFLWAKLRMPALPRLLIGAGSNLFAIAGGIFAPLGVGLTLVVWNLVFFGLALVGIFFASNAEEGPGKIHHRVHPVPVQLEEIVTRI